MKRNYVRGIVLRMEGSKTIGEGKLQLTEAAPSDFPVLVQEVHFIEKSERN